MSMNITEYICRNEKCLNYCIKHRINKLNNRMSNISVLEAKNQNDDEIAFELVKMRLCKYNFEKNLLESRKNNREVDSRIEANVNIKGSGIKAIDFRILEWLKERLSYKDSQDNVINENIQFYLWVESNYIEHFKQYLYNRDEYFRKEKS